MVGDLPAHKIYEDEHTLAFLDIHPINPGHTLVIPKVHEADFYTLDDTFYGALMNSVQKVARLVNSTLAPKKVGLAVAGFDVSHAHVHVIPLHHENDLTSEKLLQGTLGNPTPAELDEVAKQMLA